MASTKRVTGNYDVYTDLLTVHGNLKIIGSTANVTVANSFTSDNTIYLNSGETSAGVSAGTAGLEVSRGSSPNAQWIFTETNTFWSGKINGSYVNIRAASPVDNNDVVTKAYLLGTGSVSSGTERSIQFANTGSTLGGNAQFSYYANGNVVLGTTLITNTSVIGTTGSNDLTLDSGATLYIKDTMKLDFQTGSTPTNVASTVQLLANTPGQGGSGLYVVNSNYSDELISKRKATWLGLVFS